LGEEAVRGEGIDQVHDLGYQFSFIPFKVRGTECTYRKSVRDN
jgi:hypothetical protein